MIIQKTKGRRSAIEELRLKHLIEMTVAMNRIRTTKLISLEESRLASRRLMNVLMKLELISKISNKENKSRPRYHISDHLEKILYNELSNHKEFNQYVKNSTK
ncbi:hypothetical protein VCHA29O37_160044 [Vibrio chagasii]|nr:hypothetical protein VCHA29O37_160044 [Vibrio chagasii]